MLSKNRVASNHLRSIIADDAEKEVERFLKSILKGSKFEGKVKLVGGYVRDEYLSIIKNDPSIKAKDLDIIVTYQGGAEELTKYIHGLFTEPNPVSTPRRMGESYPIWQITFKTDLSYKNEIYHTEGAVVEFVDPMKESYPDPSTRQRKVEPGTLKEDIERRDFTVNQLLKDLTTGEFEDLTGVSKSDIEKGILRGNPNVPLDKMFSEDPLRMIRLGRFHCKYGWDIPLSVIRSVKRNAERISIVSSERIMGELEKVMKLGKLKQAIKYMSATGLLKHILPEVEALKGTPQNPEYHSEGDAYRHTLMVLQNSAPGVENQIAALLHDIGKPTTTQVFVDSIKSKGHEEVGADIAEGILRRLKFDTETINKVKKMVRNHMRPHALGRIEEVTTKAIRKFIREVGDEMVDSVLDLARADELGKIPPTDQIPDLKKKIDEVRKQVPVTKEQVLNGKEVMELLNIQQGPEVGKALKMVQDIEDDYSEKGQKVTKEEAKKQLLERWKK